MMNGNIGRSIMKTSAVSSDHLNIEGNVVFEEQNDLIKAFKNDELNKDFMFRIPISGS